MLKSIFTSKVVNTVKLELTDYKSKCQRLIDSQKIVVERLHYPDITQMKDLLFRVKSSNILEDLDVFIECLSVVSQ